MTVIEILTFEKNISELLSIAVTKKDLIPDVQTVLKIN